MTLNTETESLFMVTWETSGCFKAICQNFKWKEISKGKVLKPNCPGTHMQEGTILEQCCDLVSNMKKRAKLCHQDTKK